RRLRPDPKGHHPAPGEGARTRHRHRGAVRDVAPRDLAPPQGPRKGGPGSARAHRPGAHPGAGSRAAARGAGMGVAVRGVLERPSRPPREILRHSQGETEMKTIDITLSRTIPAAPDAVFDVWIDPKSPGGPWFGSPKAVVQPKVDGLFYLPIEHQGRTWAHY